MIKKVTWLDTEKTKILSISTGSTWDKKTCYQLCEDYNIFYHGQYNALMVLDNGMCVIGTECDGTITFPVINGEYSVQFHPFYIPDIVTLLMEGWPVANRIKQRQRDA